MTEVRGYPPKIRGRILYCIRLWLRWKVTEQGEAVHVLGALLRDLESVVLAPECNAEEQTVADEVAGRMVEELGVAFHAGELRCGTTNQIIGPAMEALAMDLARRIDRGRQGAVVPVDTGMGTSVEEEESEIGLQITHWLRQQLRVRP